MAALLVERASGLISAANDAAGKLFGRRADKLIGVEFKTMAQDTDEATRLVLFLNETRSGSRGLHLRAIRPLGPFTADLRVGPLVQDAWDGWLVFLSDVTSVEEATRALRQSERDYRRMVEASPDAMLVIKQGTVIFANAAVESLLGLDGPQELWMSDWERWLDPEDFGFWAAQEGAVLGAGPQGQTRAELRLRRLDSKLVEAEVALHILTHDDENALLVVARDVGPRKQMERRLRESEERYKGLADVAFDGVVVHFEGVILATNRSFEAIFGMEGDSRGLSLFDLVLPEQVEQFKSELDSGKALELQGKGKDDVRVDIEVSTRACAYMGEPAHVTAVRDISARKRAEQAIQHQAYYDGLTGLPNRLLFLDRLTLALEQAARDTELIAVLFLDLDRFKPVNDTLGHGAGDELLRQVAGRLEELVLGGDTVSRLGGDEFTVLLRGLKESRDAALVAETIVREMNENFAVVGRQVRVGCSVGIAMYPEHGRDAETLLKSADKALYRAKDLGRNQYQFWSFDQDAGQPTDRLSMEASLREALEKKQFLLRYQPKINLATGEIVGAEALVRWQHPSLGLVPPDDFIPLAEETRLILPLGDWVLGEACAQAQKWVALGLPRCSVAVNLSAWQLDKASLLKSVDQALKVSGLDPKLLELEITETVAMRNPSETISILRELRSRGVRVALDDFGKGYSSMGYLKRLPVDLIKIDQSFVRDMIADPRDAAIVKALALLAKDLGLETVAEGIETLEQAQAAKRYGCTLGQGYLYAKPLAQDQFEAFLRASLVKAPEASK